MSFGFTCFLICQLRKISLFYSTLVVSSLEGFVSSCGRTWLKKIIALTVLTVQSHYFDSTSHYLSKCKLTDSWSSCASSSVTGAMSGKYVSFHKILYVFPRFLTSLQCISSLCLTVRKGMVGMEKLQKCEKETGIYSIFTYYILWRAHCIGVLRLTSVSVFIRVLDQGFQGPC